MCTSSNVEAGEDGMLEISMMIHINNFADETFQELCLKAPSSDSV